MGLIRDMKDRVISKLAASYLTEKFLTGIGEIQNLQIDSARKSITADLFLRGESTPISITFNYTINSRDQHTFLTIHNLTSSREWLPVAFNRYFSPAAIPIDPKIEKFL